MALLSLPPLLPPHLPIHESQHPEEQLGSCVCVCVCMCAYTFVHVCIMHVCVCMCAYTFVHVCIVHVCIVHVCMCAVCVYNSIINSNCVVQRMHSRGKFPALPHLMYRGKSYIAHKLTINTLDVVGFCILVYLCRATFLTGNKVPTHHMGSQ